MRKRRSGASQRTVMLLGIVVLSALMGRAEAVAPATPTISVSPSTLTPYISGGCYNISPCYRVTGHTDTGVKVTVTATDQSGGKVTVTTYSAERTDPFAGINAGDYFVAPNVTPLGRHDTTASTLTFTAYAEDSGGAKSPVSTPFVVTKVAATAGDTNPPTLSSGGSYPSTVCGAGWCNTSTSTCILGSILHNRNACTGRYKMAGSSEDLNETSFGVASEIADVLLKVTDSSGAVVTTVHALGLRRGTQGFWAADIVATDYAMGESYDWTLVAIDAAGNVSAPIEGSFTRYPA